MNPTAAQQISAPVACLNCRDRHVKCDGNLAGCARCKTANVSCCFLPSRRGRRYPPTPHLADLSDPSASPVGISPTPSICQQTSDDLFAFTALADSDMGNTTGPAHPQPVTSCGTDLVMLYFLHFHPAHPFLPSHGPFLQSDPPTYLIDLVKVVGSHYISPTFVNTDRINNLQATVQDAVLTLEKIQALLLLSIIQHARILPRAAKECLGQAIDGTLQLGLQHRDTAEREALRNPVLAESLRRTWWEVFILDTLLAAVQVEGSLQLMLDETPDVVLPCSEPEEYDGRCGDLASVSARDLDSTRHLLYGDYSLSAAAYRVEAAILLRRCLLASSRGSIDALDAAIAAWFHRLPQAKRAVLNHEGQVDQMMFQAVTLAHCASIYLHFPRSHLVAALPVTSHVFCSSPPGFLRASADPQLHTAKVHNAAIAISKLGSLSMSVVEHTPFFCCVLVLSSIIQIAVRSAGSLGSLTAPNHFLGLNFGVLKSMGEIWEIAAMSRMRIRDVAIEAESALGTGNLRIEDMVAA